MNKTLSFLRLDFISIKQYLTVKQLALYAVILLVLSYTMQGSSYVIGMLMMYGLFYAAYPFAIGDKCQIDVLYASLPVQKRNIVAGRYLFALSINLATAVISLALAAFVSVAFRQSFDLTEVALTALVCFFLYSIFESIQFPFYFKMGYTKARVISFLPLILIPAVLVAGTMVIPEAVWKPALQGAALWLDQHLMLAALSAIAIWLCILLTSAVLSYRIYQKRDF